MARMDDLSVEQIIEKIKRSTQRKLAVMSYPPAEDYRKVFKTLAFKKGHIVCSVFSVSGRGERI